MKKQSQNEFRLQVEELEERIAPDSNNNPPFNNTNNPGNEGIGGEVSTGSDSDGGGGNPGNNNPPLNNTNNSGNEGIGGEVSTGK
jgi:hypothetical protein